MGKLGELAFWLSLESNSCYQIIFEKLNRDTTAGRGGSENGRREARKQIGRKTLEIAGNCGIENFKPQRFQ